MEAVVLGGLPSLSEDGRYSGGVSVALIHRESSSAIVLDAGLMKEPARYREYQRISLMKRPEEKLPAKLPFLTAESLLPNWSALDDFKNIYILITHAHSDHAAGLPFLYKRMKSKGKCIKVVMRYESYLLMKILLLDMLKIFESRGETMGMAIISEFLFRHRRKDFIFLNKPGPLHLGQFSVEAFSAGHILGSIAYLITAPDRKKRIIFTGDISFSNQSLLYPSRILEGSGAGVDFLITEATNAIKNISLDRGEEEKAFIAEVERIRNQGGWALIPALAIGRSSEVLSVLNRNGIQPFLEGGMAKEVVGDYQHLGGFNLRYKEFKYYAVREKIRRSTVVVAPSGMLNGGWSLWWARKVIDDPRSAILMTCWQDPFGGGSFLLGSKTGEKILFHDTIKDKWEEKIVRATIKQFNGFSTHPYLDRLKKASSNAKRTMLIHGDYDSLNAALAIKNSFIPELGREYTL